jgi:hypothetical protein
MVLRSNTSVSAPTLAKNPSFAAKSFCTSTTTTAAFPGAAFCSRVSSKPSLLILASIPSPFVLIATSSR